MSNPLLTINLFIVVISLYRRAGWMIPDTEWELRATSPGWRFGDKSYRFTTPLEKYNQRWFYADHDYDFLSGEGWGV